MYFFVENLKFVPKKTLISLSACLLFPVSSLGSTVNSQNNSLVAPARTAVKSQKTHTSLHQGNKSGAQVKPSNTPSTTQTATVLLKNGTLQVEANNSDLSQILSQVATAGGMKIDGSVPSARVYGTYGPGNARAVLTSLLTGLGYNFMMIGSTQEGIPSKLLLTSRTNQPATPPPSASTPPSSAAPTNATNDDLPGPGAIVNVPPAGPDDPQERAQQNLQRLQQMHDQQIKPMQPQ